MINNEIYIKHKDWEGLCILNENKIYRKNVPEEYGNFNFLRNKLTIKWEKWKEEEFFYYDNSSFYYLKILFQEIYKNIFILYPNNIILVILNKKNNNNVLIDNNNINGLIDNKKIKKGDYKIDKNKLFLKYNNENIDLIKLNDCIYCSEEDFNKQHFFELNIKNDKIDEKYIFNKINKKFISLHNVEYIGSYDFIENSISMKWNNGYYKKFYTNKYESFGNINENITFIKPNSIFLDNRVLISNISLCKKKIIISSIYYKNNPWDLNQLEFLIDNNKILNKIILENDHFESSLNIIIELENIQSNLFIKIIYKKINIYSFLLEQLDILDHSFSAMTLFKDDYYLLKTYLNYYSNLGIEIFFIYYNNIIDNNLINNIVNLNINNVKIYVIEWNYIYWYNYEYNLKHHHAQTMCINDSLNILKNYGIYCLFNDLDEYIILEKYIHFNELIDLNKDIDIFIFKNRFCKMGNNLIAYKNFYKEFDLKKIIKGNYWDNQREKNIVKLNSISIMGVHGHYNKNKLNEKIIGEFYHIVNFEEKNREKLMTEYITIL